MEIFAEARYYIQHEKWLALYWKSLQRKVTSSSMKKGWVCSGSPCGGKAYIQHEKGLALLMKTYMEVRPTSSMKKGYLCRTYYDE